MIDWVTAIIPCHHGEKIYGGSVASVNLDGEIEWRVEKKQQVRGSNESSINIKSLDPYHILLDGNPAKWLQGHNIFGSDDLIGLVNAVMQKLIPLLNLTPTVVDLFAWQNGLYILKRVDCTAMWDLPRIADVRAWLRAAEMQSKSRHGRPVTTGGTLYFGKNSRRWSVKFYAKGDEIEARGHKLSDDLEHRDKLLEWADNMLRGELTLRSIQLKEKGLSEANKWAINTPLEQLITYIESLNMSEQFSITPVNLEGLPARLVAVYKLWKDGEDLRAMYPKASFYRYRSELLKQGIDIAIRQPSKPDNIIPLVRVLRPEAIAQVPDWAIGTSLYYNPNKQNKVI
ncbi:MAG TPA: phage/plasmid replication protein, II/X family [Methylotenera sp.]|nr:phage/plasmid replication protein, II/X family [Methylotenera sp.]HPH04295.1 phage/plasmid replication protein, II/X family [Methylotenera sp.]HPM99849.1 phage/plasmid replication protein, II/X family [Methylotenera sp.]